jgi:TatD DNase family protein
MYVDSHCHLDDPQFDPDRSAVIARARAAGVRYLLAIAGGNGPHDLGAGLRIMEQAEVLLREPPSSAGGPGASETIQGGLLEIYMAGGIHPHEAAKAQEKHYEELRRLAEHPKFLAVGEIGLDYHSDHSPRDLQKEVFIKQLDLARELRLPIIIHCRDAWDDLRSILHTQWVDDRGSGDIATPCPGGILHCFSGTCEDAQDLVACGFIVSFAGNLTFRKAEALRSVARAVPPERLLTETDCPYLAPVPYRGKRCEPAYVRETTGQLAILHGISQEAMARRVLENFRRFFDLAAF